VPSRRGSRLRRPVNELTAQLRKVEGERDEYRKLVLHLKEENERLRRGLLGQKAEPVTAKRCPALVGDFGDAMAGVDSSSEAEASRRRS